MDWPKQTRGLTPATDTESASDIFRADKVSKSLVAHFWGSKLLMITVRLSARHSAPAEPLPVVKVTDPTGRGGGGDERLRHRQGALNIMVYMRHQWLESKKSNQELRIKHSDAECSGTEMCNIIKILHKHKLKLYIYTFLLSRRLLLCISKHKQWSLLPSHL